jgi:hypothetical protein
MVEGVVEFSKQNLVLSSRKILSVYSSNGSWTMGKEEEEEESCVLREPSSKRLLFPP